MTSVRALSLDTIEAVFKEGAYSNLKINEVLNQVQLNPSDRGLYTALVYGTIQRKLTLDYFLKPFLKTKIKGWVRRLLWMSIYQFVYMDKIPTHAIINEAVSIAKKRGGQQTGNTVNAILRRLTTESLPQLSTIKNDIERLSIMYSVPVWIIKHWKTHYGIDTTEAIAQEMLKPVAQTVRVNQTLITVNDAMKALEKEGFHIEQDTELNECLHVSNGSVIHSQLFKDGKMSIQDKSSMFVSAILAPQHGDLILDCCSAPGGKACHTAEMLNGTGHVEATDIHPHKIELIKHNINKLKLNNISTYVHDATEPYTKQYDKIIVDAPCSGLGVLRHKPEIKYMITEQDVTSLVDLQLQILENVSQHLKVGGTLVYSTCTIEQMENENVIYSFLKAHPEFEFEVFENPKTNERIKTLQLLPQDFNTDGFFITKIKRKEHA
ncbi:16S rRNA (cytosine(967)-C(5))-methyltransferase RsmB [Staphylococcus agnetis]|uniref:16S rRNA (cytosine(967)-C(5))-methyltransferase RsmB n=1 Tax=Staphylococcus agnetis TaxID=985762 RepID=UPI0004E39CB6|nr:16S rRNA (cytosine(967)-C(5))-methyltransferase RsmB [Staphylococcus agnetis]KFE42915.1 16S rRNA methyltransferase B [Staphylococcus agnetis]NJH66118.1 16S rRNA (cytosine(967)-C(5))-methyltransferase RsmB [Staphylococcus agnetis]NJH97985.1 16S rRNA (cytosine(967)-C(5))-methyltransferase RsmB [Staphylococcus agnetis]PTH47881.1 16S rRNA (cytosine(967)-C(5))-methyltransferase RsmB [Staphylococcus agnetis]PTH73977.1 16S rRNA (cytosine(967)-C(5))-methyltransferase RsmB [Staphylococcus agnetis]